MSKKLKILVVLLLCAWVTGFGFTNKGYASSYGKPVLTVSPNTSGNYISLKWTTPNSADPWTYQIMQLKPGESSPQSIPSKSTVKVLNVYPQVENNNITFKNWKGQEFTLPKSASVKEWMEEPNTENSKGYGMGLISVDCVALDDFNKSPYNYLKDANGDWKYDVVFEGAWDCNGNFYDLSTSAVDALTNFIESGRGFLAGHDTNIQKYNMPNAAELSKKFLNESFGANEVGSTRVKINKKGLLTSYPWKIGDLGDILTVPLSHSDGQFAKGDVWLNYADEGTKWGDFSNVQSELNGETGTNNFYLTTWNNTAQIQTGHSNGEATPDEQKVLANTLFYLSQLTQSTSWDDHSGQDLSAPTKPTISNITYDKSSKDLKVSYSPSSDTGSTYKYQVVATNQNDGTKVSSDETSATIKSGLKGYSIVVDDSKDTVITNSDTVTNSVSYETTVNKTKSFYVHIAAVDNAGNISTTSTSLVDVDGPDIKVQGNPTSEVHKSIYLTINASDVSGVKRIQTPDGVWHDGDSLSYKVLVNGDYVFTAEDNQGNTSKITVNVTNIGSKFNLYGLKDKVFFSPVYLDGTSMTSYTSGLGVTIEDNRETNEGWRLMAGAGRFTDGSGHELPINSLRLSSPSVSGDGVLSPTGNSWYLDSGNNVTLLSASSGNGKGTYNLLFNDKESLKLMIPGDAYAGSYSSTINWELVTAP